MKQYAIGDIHGHYDLLRQTLDWVEQQEPGEVIFLGDYIDRGPKNKQVVELLMEGPPKGWSWTFIRGNHEDMAIEAHSSLPHAKDMWLINGGHKCLQEWGDSLPKEVLAFFDKMPRYYYDRYRVFTHGNAVNAYPLEKQPEEVTQWGRPKDGVDRSCHGRYVVHGHTPQKGDPFIGKNRANLDVGGVWSNTLAVAVFDNTLEGPPLHVEIVKWRVKFPVA